MSPTAQIMLGLVLGLIVGYVISTFDDATAARYAGYIRPFSQIFIRMIQMLIAPLLFGTLVAGIAGAGHFKDVGRMGLRAIIYFEVVTTLALFIGLFAVNILLVAGVLALALIMPGWVAGLLVGGVLLLAAAVVGYVSWSRHMASPLALTRKTMKENVRWAKEQIA